MPKHNYTCKGSCAVTITEEEFHAGKHVCTSDGCDHLAQPLTKQIVCERCGESFIEGEQHVCPV
ncbi:hypothetical protein ACFL2U_02665 [Patescibacteria group bacterium]